MKESDFQKLIQLDRSKQGIRLWRNNVGVLVDATGRPVRFGLANDSAQVNKKIKSGDLIGITPHIIRPIDVGHMVGIFTSEEIKVPGWVYTGRGREEAQQGWIDLVRSLGGIAKFTSER